MLGHKSYGLEEMLYQQRQEGFHSSQFYGGQNIGNLNQKGTCPKKKHLLKA
jgi:hypothetical protein